MAYLPTTFLGRFVLGTIVFLYILLLVLNLVSFGGLAWITYVDFNVRFGLWRVCYGTASASRACYQWSGGRNIIDDATNIIIFSGKPDFVRAAQGLEIVSLIFYVFAGILIIMGIIDLARAPLEYMFGAAAVLLFLSIIFLSASLGVMSDRGRDNHRGAYLGWAWWIGLIGLIITIICVAILIGFIVDVARQPNDTNYADQFGGGQQQLWNFSPTTSLLANAQMPLFPYPSYNQWSPQNQAVPFTYPTVDEQNISQIFAMMARERFLNPTETQRQQQQLGYPYRQSAINSYF